MHNTQSFKKLSVCFDMEECITNYLNFNLNG